MDDKKALSNGPGASDATAIGDSGIKDGKEKEGAVRRKRIS